MKKLPFGGKHDGWRLVCGVDTQITALIQKNGSTKLEAAKHCSATQPRINELLRGRISRFLLDAPVNIAAHHVQRVHVELQAA